MTAIHHPAPLNQFYQLDVDIQAGKPVNVKTTRWNHGHVRNGVWVNYDGTMCMSTEGAVALDAHTQGRIHATPGQIHDHQDDMSGGIGVNDVDTSWGRGWGQNLLTPADFNWADILYAVRSERRHVVIGVDYRKVPYAYQVQKNGNFDHALGIDDFRATDSEIYRYDSLDTKAVWVPQSAIRAAAEALALRVRGTSQRLFVGLTASRPLVATANYRVSIHPEAGTKGYPSQRYFGLYTVSGGTITKAAVARTGGFSANADARGFYAWPGHGKLELVRLTSGSRAGFYVRTNYIV